MHIAFKFRYIHDNALFGRLLEAISARSPLPLNLYREGDEYGIEVSGEQNGLEAVATLVSSMVPNSLFLQTYTVEEIETLREPRPLDCAADSYAIPCCPECQQKVLDTLEPFLSCSVCGFSDTVLGWDDLQTFTGIEGGDAERFFGEVAEKLIREGEISLPTYNGIRRFSLMKGEAGEDEGILICDPSEMSGSWIITQGELDTLMMIEKPSVRLKPKLKFRAENALEKPFYPVFFPDDTITMAMSAALKRKGIRSVYCDHLPSLRAASALEHHVILSSGRDMVPWRHPSPLSSASCCTFEGFSATGGKEGIFLGRDEGMRMPECVRFVAGDEPVAIPNAVVFEPAHAALRSVVLEHSLEGKSLCGIYLSRRRQSQICSFSARIGYTPMVSFGDKLLSDPSAMLESIGNMDEAGARLLQNYRTAYPDLYETVVRARFRAEGELSMLGRLWAMAALVIGLSKGEDALEACEQLEAAALEFGGKSGPRIDYKVIRGEEGYRLDPRRAIRSAMSFKLAGVDNYLLSFGFIDSLADFIAQQAEMADANIGIEGIALGGDLFENRQLLMRTYNALSRNYPVFRNLRLGMDGANVAAGAVTLGSE